MTHRRRLIPVAVIVAVLVGAGGYLLTPPGRALLRGYNLAQGRATASHGGAVNLRGAEMDAAPGALTTNGTLTIHDAGRGAAAPPPSRLGRALGAAYNFSVDDAQVRGTLTLVLPVDPSEQPAKDTPIFAAFYDEAAHGWVPYPGRYDAQRHAVVVDATHLSWWAPWTWDWSAIKDHAIGAFDSLLHGFSQRGDPPACSPEDGSGSVTRSSDVTLACLEGERAASDTLRLVDNRGYSMLVHVTAGVTVQSSGTGGLYDTLWRPLAQYASGDTYLPATEEADLSVPVGPGSWTLTTRASAATFLGDVFITVIKTLLPEGAEAERLVTSGAECLATVMHTKPIVTLDAGAAREVARMALDCLGTVITTANPLSTAFAIVKDVATKTFAGLELVADLGKTGDIMVHRAAQDPPPPAATPTPAAGVATPGPTHTSQTGFAIGDEFNDQCSVAWPTAPTITSAAIILTMTCQHVPESRFQFVQVDYPDPNLPITPSTQWVHVHGHVADIARSDFGFRILVVDADQIQL